MIDYRQREKYKQLIRDHVVKTGVGTADSIAESTGVPMEWMGRLLSDLIWEGDIAFGFGAVKKGNATLATFVPTTSDYKLAWQLARQRPWWQSLQS